MLFCLAFLLYFLLSLHGAGPPFRNAFLIPSTNPKENGLQESPASKKIKKPAKVSSSAGFLRSIIYPELLIRTIKMIGSKVPVVDSIIFTQLIQSSLQHLRYIHPTRSHLIRHIDLHPSIYYTLNEYISLFLRSSSSIMARSGSASPSSERNSPPS